MMGFGSGYGMGAGGWIAMTIFWVALITLIVWGLSRTHPAGSGRGADSTPRGGGARGRATDTAEDILDRRLAVGELDEDTYRSLRATLDSSRTTGTESR